MYTHFKGFMRNIWGGVRNSGWFFFPTFDFLKNKKNYYTRSLRTYSCIIKKMYRLNEEAKRGKSSGDEREREEKEEEVLKSLASGILYTRQFPALLSVEI